MRDPSSMTRRPSSCPADGSLTHQPYHHADLRPHAPDLVSFLQSSSAGDSHQPPSIWSIGEVDHVSRGQVPMPQTARLPLEGIRVIDAATLMAAPWSASYLGEFGADVIKVEQPKIGDHQRRWGTKRNGIPLMWNSLSRNKRSITLDLRKPKGADVFRRLIATADVLIENFRPGTLERWGLGPDELLAINPRLVVLRVTGYGQTGPCLLYTSDAA